MTFHLLNLDHFVTVSADWLTTQLHYIHVICVHSVHVSGKIHQSLYVSLSPVGGCVGPRESCVSQCLVSLFFYSIECCNSCYKRMYVQMWCFLLVHILRVECQFCFYQSNSCYFTHIFIHPSLLSSLSTPAWNCVFPCWATDDLPIWGELVQVSGLM